MDIKGTTYTRISSAEEWRSELVCVMRLRYQSDSQVYILFRVSVSRAVKPLADDPRPADYFSQKVIQTH